MSVLAAAKAKVRRWRKDPVFFVTDELKAEPDAWQIDGLQALPHPDKDRRIAFKACKGVGKTGFEAWAILWFLSCMGERGEHPKGAATAVSEKNIDDNLWPEIAKWRGRSQFLLEAFTWTHTRVSATHHPETWFFSKRTWPKSGDPQQQAETLAGLHAKYLFFVVDESGGVPDAVMAAAEGGLTGSDGGWQKILQGGNPTRLEGPLYRAATSERHLWKLIEITGDPDDPQRSKRQSVKWAKEQIEKYGRDNPWVLVNVFGKFPPSSINSLLGPDEVSKALGKHLREHQYNWAQKRLGVDVARFGDDRTVIFPRQGLAAFRSVEMRGARTTEIAARVAEAKTRWGSEMEFVDGTGGWGMGVVDNLIASGFSPHDIQFHGKAIDPRYLNRRAEMWFKMAEWVKKGGALPNDPDMARELTAPTYTFVNGKFQLESKDQIKERLGFSPDKADALCLTFALPDMPKGAETSQKQGQGGKALSEYDPYSDERMGIPEYD